MNKIDKKLYFLSLILFVITTIVTFLLPDKISLTFSEGREKSKYFLILLSLIPAITTYLITTLDMSRLITTAFLVGVSFYILLIVISSFGFSIPIEAIVLIILSSCMLVIALKIKSKDSKVKINLKYVDNKDVYENLQKAGFIMFLTLSIEMITFSILILLKVISPTISIPVILITGFIFALLILKLSIKNK